MQSREARWRIRLWFNVTVYTESNFVLELALLQEQQESCERMLALASEGRIALVLPAYSLIEPFETLSRRFKKRQSINEDVRTELRQLGRSTPYEDHSEALEKFAALFIRSQEEERARLQEVVSRLLAVATLIPLDAAVIDDSLEFQRQEFSAQDAVVFASVLRHLALGTDDEYLFLNRNSKDFDDPDVQDRLGESNCHMIFSFDDGYEYLMHHFNGREA